MKAKQVFAPFGTLFSTAVLTAQCAACPAAQHFVVRDACHEHFCKGFFAPRARPTLPTAAKWAKRRQKPRFLDFLFRGRFYETNCRGAPSGTLFVLMSH